MEERKPFTFSVLTVSDRCYAKEAEDISGPELKKVIETGQLFHNSQIVWSGVVPDDKSKIQATVTYCCDVLEANVVVTTGGTGLSPRDVTPDSVTPLLDWLAPGLAHLILIEGLKKTPFAALSRGVVGVRKRSLVVTLPGSVRGALEGFHALAPVLPHAMDLILDRKPEVALKHGESEANRHSKVSVHTDEASRLRASAYSMVSMEHALEHIHAQTMVLKSESTPAHLAVGRVLAQNVIAPYDIPLVPTSMKDGYAIGYEPAGVFEFPVRIVGECTPGQMFTETLHEGEAVKVSTGSAVPPGALCVVPVEETYLKENGNENEVEGVFIYIRSDPSRLRLPGSDIRKPGSDLEEGKVVAKQGTLVGETELALLASIGEAHVVVVKKPVVALLSTGDELQDPWGPFKSNRVRDSNKPMLKALLEAWGYVTVDLGIAHDEPNAVFASLRAGFQAADVVVSTGGMSMGERDLLKDVLLQDLNATIHFGRLAMKPGKPTGFASVPGPNGDTKYWFGLPGNPASAFVTAHLILLPALRLASGWSNNVCLPRLLAKLEEDVPRDKERIEYMRAIVTFVDSSGAALNRPSVITTGRRAQQSSSVQGCARANCLLEVPKGDGKLNQGDVVTTLLLPK